MEKEHLNEVLERLREVTILAHKSLFAIGDGIKYDPNVHKLAETIAFPEDSFIAYKGMSVTESGGTYWLKFSALGELKSALASARLPIKFCTLLMNEKFRSYLVIENDDDLNKLFYQSVFSTLHSKRVFDLHSVDEDETSKALLKIENLLLFPRIKYA